MKKTKADTINQNMYNLPFGHNLDDKTWDLLGIYPDGRDKNPESDLTLDNRKIDSGVLNSVQDPNTRMSSTTATDNLDETNIAPLAADSTVDGLDNFYEEMHTPHNSAFASALKKGKVRNNVVSILKTACRFI